ncbi:MAG TPA: hypothetical protein VG146_05060 [Verrucomicrobiae bacterium]|nr:hypothetical protein [Verrucomicrobiae bacterium]
MRKGPRKQIEHAVFRAPPLVSEAPVVTRLWIGSPTRQKCRSSPFAVYSLGVDAYP